MHTVFTVAFTTEMIDVKCHPAVAKNVVKSVIVFPNQLGKKNIFLLRFRDLSMQPLIIGRSGDTQLLAHPANAPPLILIEIPNRQIFRFKLNLS